MTKIQKTKKKISRKYCPGEDLWGRGKPRKNYKPGVHGPAGSRGRPTNYALQLKAKQKLKYYYGRISEAQFRKTFDKAVNMKGDTIENFIGLLESRLDTIVYRANFAPTIFSARQLVTHKHILVNGKGVNIPSYKVKPGDVVSVRAKSKNIPLIIDSVQKMERDVPTYLNLNKDDMSITYVHIPNFVEVPYPVEMQPNLIVELYSK